MTYLPGESVCSATFMKTQFNPKSTNTHTMRRKTITEKRLKDIKEVSSNWKSMSLKICKRLSSPLLAPKSIYRDKWQSVHLKCKMLWEWVNTHTYTASDLILCEEATSSRQSESENSLSQILSLFLFSIIPVSLIIATSPLPPPDTFCRSLSFLCVVKTKIKS